MLFGGPAITYILALIINFDSDIVPIIFDDYYIIT